MKCRYKNCHEEGNTAHEGYCPKHDIDRLLKGKGPEIIHVGAV